MNLCKDRPAPFPTYLLVYDVRTGEEHFKEIGEDTPLDMDALISEWVQEQFYGEAEVDFPPLRPRGLRGKHQDRLQ